MLPQGSVTGNFFAESRQRAMKSSIYNEIIRTKKSYVRKQSLNKMAGPGNVDQPFVLR